MLSVRRYQPEDQDAIWDLHNRALHAVGAHAGNGSWDDDLHHIEEAYLASGGEFLVGLVDGQIVAMGALLPEGPGQGSITRMRVAPEAQGQGLGSRILRELEGAAKARGYTRLRLTTTTVQVAAQRFYDKHGYRRTAYGEEAGFTTIRYEKSVLEPGVQSEESDDEA